MTEKGKRKGGKRWGKREKKRGPKINISIYENVGIITRSEWPSG